MIPDELPALDGVTLRGSRGRSSLVVEPFHHGDRDVVLSVYVDNDGPSVSLTAEQLRKLAIELECRADLLDAAAEVKA